MTPRRWLAFCNPPLAKLITSTLGHDNWVNHLDKLQVAHWHNSHCWLQCSNRFCHYLHEMADALQQSGIDW